MTPRRSIQSATLFRAFALLAVLGAALLPTISVGAVGTKGDLNQQLPALVRSRAIETENNRPGTTAWHLPTHNVPSAIQGFASTTSAVEGQRVNIYVTTHAKQFSVSAFRMGWYHGRGAREVWSSALQQGRVQPRCPVSYPTNMVSCTNWRRSLVMTITPAFVPGDYLLKLSAGENASYILLTVVDPASHATFVVMNRSMVEQGWNTYGGYDFYQGRGPCTLDQSPYPACNRARVVSFDRPQAIQAGASDFLTNEYPLVQLVERLGLNVTYITDVDLSADPALLDHHVALLTLDHDEAWTYSERLAVQRASARGLNVVYFGAAAMVRHVRLAPSPFGPNQEVVDYRNPYEDPINGHGHPMQVTGNTWGDGPGAWSPLHQIGEQYVGYLSGTSAAMVVSDPHSWLYDHAHVSAGEQLPGAIASDIDHATTFASEPIGLDVLSHSPIALSDGFFSGARWQGTTYADVVYFTSRVSQSGVLDTGNNVWIGDLRSCSSRQRYCLRPVFTQMTINILRLFGSGPTGFVAPSTGNLASLTPSGS